MLALRVVSLNTLKSTLKAHFGKSLCQQNSANNETFTCSPNRPYLQTFQLDVVMGAIQKKSHAPNTTDILGGKFKTLTLIWGHL